MWLTWKLVRGSLVWKGLWEGLTSSGEWWVIWYTDCWREELKSPELERPVRRQQTIISRQKGWYAAPFVTLTSSRPLHPLSSPSSPSFAASSAADKASASCTMLLSKQPPSKSLCLIPLPTTVLTLRVLLHPGSKRSVDILFLSHYISIVLYLDSAARRADIKVVDKLTAKLHYMKTLLWCLSRALDIQGLNLLQHLS